MPSQRSLELPRVRIARSAWQRCVSELDRAAPHEAVLVPLIALRVRDLGRNPCAPLALTDLAELTVPTVLTVPERLQRASPVRVGVLPSTNRLLNPRIEAFTRSHPRLRTAAYLHSHPFAHERTWPSQGARADYEGHMLPLLGHNRQSGLETSFSFIACRTGGACRAEAAGVGGRWILHCFALDADERIVDLGFATVIDDEDPRVDEALLPGLRRVPPARTLVRRLRRRLRREGISTHWEELFDGWSRLRIEIGASVVVALLPDRFPDRPARWFVVQGGDVEPVDPPSILDPSIFTAWLLEDLKGETRGAA